MQGQKTTYVIMLAAAFSISLTHVGKTFAIAALIHSLDCTTRSGTYWHELTGSRSRSIEWANWIFIYFKKFTNFKKVSQKVVDKKVTVVNLWKKLKLKQREVLLNLR